MKRNMGILSKIFNNKNKKKHESKASNKPESKTSKDSNIQSANAHYEIPKLTTMKIGEEIVPICKCDKDGLLIGWAYNNGLTCRPIYSRLKNETIVEWLKIMSEEDSRVIGEIYRVFKEYRSFSYAKDERKCDGYGEEE